MIITCDMCKYQDICSTNSECALVAKKYEPCFTELTLNGEDWLEGDYYERDEYYERKLRGEEDGLSIQKNDRNG